MNKSFFRTVACLLLLAFSTTLAAESSNAIGKLDNGLTCHLIPSFNSQNGMLIKLSYGIPKESENASLELLLQHALFYGTKEKSRQEIAETLNHLGFDIDADHFIQNSENDLSFQFCLSQEQLDSSFELLMLLHEIVLDASLTDNGIEMARRHLLEKMDPTQTDESLSLESVTASEVRAFYAEWVRPENMQLLIAGFKDAEYELDIVSICFKSPVQKLILSEIDTEERELNALELASDNTMIIDGKIRMRRPDLINNRTFGHFLGKCLAVVGITGMIVAFPLAAPIAPAIIAAGSISTMTGAYFLYCDYIKDPYFVEEVRKVDLQKGCAHAYQNKRAGITLTPYERRVLFLEEMVDHPHTLNNLPILILTDLYYLNDPIIAELFTEEEFSILRLIKSDFTQQRNQYKLLKDNLENQLASLTRPHAIIRDNALINAKNLYDNNYYVVNKKVLKVQRDVEIKNIDNSYYRHEIDYNKRNTLIRESENYYNSSIAAMQGGLSAAEYTLKQMEKQIINNYNTQVEICKQSINYNSRMQVYANGEKSLTLDFNRELREVLLKFPVTLSTLPDYLDLT